MKTYFYSYRNGDFHVVRSFICDIMKQYPSDEFLYYSCLPFIGQPDIPHVLSDIEGLNKTQPYKNIGSVPSPCYVCGDETLINVHPNVCGFDAICELFRAIYKQLALKFDDEVVNYLPAIDFSKIKTEPIDQEIKNTRCIKLRVYLANCKALSLQSTYFDLNPAVAELAKDFPAVRFYISNVMEGKVVAPNVVYVPDFTGGGCDLNENAYLSTFCPIVAGRLSGPHSFALIKDNLLNSTKTFVCFTDLRAAAEWFPSCRSKMLWATTHDWRVAKELLAGQIRKAL